MNKEVLLLFFLTLEGNSQISGALISYAPTCGNSNVFYQGSLPEQLKEPRVLCLRKAGAVANWRLHVLVKGLTLLKE